MLFRIDWRSLHRTIAGLVAFATLAVILVACSAPATTTPTTSPTDGGPAPTAPATPTTVPTTQPTVGPTAAPTQAPTVAPEPTTAPQPAGVLPAPLIYNMGGQIYRLDIDGKTTAKLTDEQPFQPDSIAITEFDVSPADGSLIYLTQQVGADNRTTQSLIRVDTDGTNRTVLLEGVYVTTPRFSPDGAQIAFGVITEMGGPAQSLQGGVYLIPTAGGTAQLVQASDQFDPANPAPDARAYTPSGWSSDGSKLLLRAFLPYAEFCETVIKDLGSDGLTKIAAPEGTVTSCGAGVWNADSSMVYLPLYEPGMFGGFAGLAQVDATSGALTTLFGNKVDDTYIRINGLRPTQNDMFLGFVATADKPFPSEPDSPTPRYTLHEIGLDGRLMALRDDSQLVWGSPLWALDASGVVIPSSDGTSPRHTLVWLPVDGGPSVELLTGEFFGEARWEG
jgi:hypothetical protein